ncbi:MAG TPA: hypothetical protein VI094_05285 [Propionibacteriaceae bacterium]
MSDASLVGTPYLGRYLVATTSGTTGTPAVFLHDETAMAVYNAIGYTRAMPAFWRIVTTALASRARETRPAERPVVSPAPEVPRG